MMKTTSTNNLFLNDMQDESKERAREYDRKRNMNRSRCNLCERLFRTNSRMDRFCKFCKSDNELFRFSEWLHA